MSVAGKRTLYWCTVAPMPYTDDLFVRLAGSADHALVVHYLQRKISKYPLPDDASARYDSRSLESRKVTLAMYRAALLDRDARWFVGGWGFGKYVVLLMILSVLRRDFVVFSDAPVPAGRTRSGVKRRIRQGLLGFWFGRARLVLGTGRMATEGLLAMGAPAAKVTSLPYPLDEGRFSVGDDYRVGSGEPVVLVCSGRLDIGDKRFDLAVRAVADLRSLAPEVPVVLRIGGSGPDEDELRSLAVELGVDDSIEFLGWLSQDQLADLYRSGNVYVHPSDFEPYGVTVVEALYGGLYTVASNRVGSAVELIEDGDGTNGRVFEAGSLASLTDQLKPAVADVAGGRIAKSTVRAASLKWSMAHYLTALDAVFPVAAEATSAQPG